MFIKIVRYMAEYKKALNNKEPKLLWRYIFRSVRNIPRQIIIKANLPTLQGLKRCALIFEVEFKRNGIRDSCFFINQENPNLKNQDKFV